MLSKESNGCRIPAVKCVTRNRPRRRRKKANANASCLIALAVLSVALHPLSVHGKEERMKGVRRKDDADSQQQERNRNNKNKNEEQIDEDERRQDNNKNKDDEKENQREPELETEDDGNTTETDAQLAPQCTLCADGSEADLFLRSQDLGLSCLDMSALAETLADGDESCRALQVIAHQDCGCPTYPDGFCTLCHGGFYDIPNRYTDVPSTKQYKCKDILFVEERVLFGGCDSLIPYRELCGCPLATPTVSCPICDQAGQEYYHDKVYEEYGLTCENLGMAHELGYTDSCVETQLKFRYFCGCPGAMPQCTLCGQGEMPPDPDKIVPTLSTTCGEINDYASLHSTSECSVELDNLDYNAAGFCGCAYYGPLMQCNFCGRGEAILVPDRVPEKSIDGATCAQLEEFATYIWDSTDLCTNVQAFAEECCDQLYHRDGVNEP